MSQTYRTTDTGKWGTGKGSNLTASEVDNNFWTAIQRIVALEAIPQHAGIDHFAVVGQTFNVVLTDSTVLGPYTLPVATFRSRGTWQPSTSYSVLDTFTINGGLYEVIFSHTSALTFDAGANDGSGHSYYALMIQSPGSSLPSGGAAGQVLSKSTSTDYAVTWSYKLPTGGNLHQVLAKASTTNQDATWQTLDGADISFTGTTASTLSSHTVTGAIEEVESDVQTLSTTVTALETTVTGLETTVAGLSGTTTTDSIEFLIDGGGSTLTTGMKGYIVVPWACTITRAILLADQSGSVVVDIYKSTYSAFDAGATHPASGDKITSSTPPTISSNVKSSNTTLSGWTTSVSAGDILAFNIDSVTSIQRVTLCLLVTR